MGKSVTYLVTLHASKYIPDGVMSYVFKNETM